MDQHTEIERNDAKIFDRFLASLAMQILECQGAIGSYVQPPGFLLNPEAGFIDMKGRACQKLFLGPVFP